MTKVDDSLPSDVWEAPDSEASETEDEFEWLRNRGARVEHDHWPSKWRTTAVAMVSQPCLRKYVHLCVLTERIKADILVRHGEIRIEGRRIPNSQSVESCKLVFSRRSDIS
jgi:hypothetical protein